MIRATGFQNLPNQRFGKPWFWLLFGCLSKLTKLSHLAYQIHGNFFYLALACQIFGTTNFGHKPIRSLVCQNSMCSNKVVYGNRLFQFVWSYYDKNKAIWLQTSWARLELPQHGLLTKKEKKEKNKINISKASIIVILLGDLKPADRVWSRE